MNRLDHLRKQLNATQSDGPIDGFIIPRGDAFSGEEVPASDDRLKYISGFSGSAGTAIVSKTYAALFSDGRYTLQMKAETSDDWACFIQPDHSMIGWIKTHLKNTRLGFDPWLMTVSVEKSMRTKLSPVVDLVSLDQNPIDQIWQDRPSMPQSKAWDYPSEYAGQTRQEKIKSVLDAIGGCDHLLITAPDQLAWLANIRGSDLDHTPVILSFALLSKKTGDITIYADGARFSDCDQSHLTFKSAEALLDDVSGLKNDVISYDPVTCPYALKSVLNDAALAMESPITIMKARKSAAEQQRIRSAHIRDGAAMVRFLSRFDDGAASGLRETEVADQLIEYRSEDPDFISPSFATICGSGGNGAIVHYRAEAGKDSIIQNNTLCLIDSGGQYKDATTDITRTIAVGTPSQDMKTHFTLVLKGHIALDQAVFPHGTSGIQLDAITRGPLWDHGMDYAHGTGHGVGCCLNVHEGPASISKRSSRAIEPGMLLSNEPGYYIENHYGIRIENLILVQECKDQKDFMEFDHVTLVPMDRRLIETDLLTTSEINWINHYHQRVCREISPLLTDDPHALAWLEDVTKPL